MPDSSSAPVEFLDSIADPAGSRRSYLFLQGPVGPFFRILGKALKAAGHQVRRINFNGGDLFDWSGPGARSFRGSAEEWPAFVRSLAKELETTDLVLFGDCRPLHAAAISELKAWRPSLRVHVFEEGYLRPDWITLESGGVNAHSPLMMIRDRYLQQPEARQPLIKPQPVGPTAVPMGRHATAHYTAMLALNWMFPRYQHHRDSRPVEEAHLWAPRLLQRHERLRKARRVELDLLASGRPFFLMLLQVHCDKQVQVHSPVKSMKEFLERVVPSFAAHAPADRMLVVKTHPLDNGRYPHEQDLLRIAKQCGVEDRVIFLDGGNLPRLLKRSAGAVTINSTAGVSALHHGVPLYCFGAALYDTAGLAHQGSLNVFWNTPQQPDRQHYDAFRHVVAHRSQINGSFYTKRGIELSLPVVLRRMTGRTEELQRSALTSADGIVRAHASDLAKLRPQAAHLVAQPPADAQLRYLGHPGEEPRRHAEPVVAVRVRRQRLRNG
jgi:capsular polysaccharide export protein